jgi:hypothetical protein
VSVNSVSAGPFYPPENVSQVQRKADECDAIRVRNGQASGTVRKGLNYSVCHIVTLSPVPELGMSFKRITWIVDRELRCHAAMAVGGSSPCAGLTMEQLETRSNGGCSICVFSVTGNVFGAVCTHWIGDRVGL